MHFCCSGPAQEAGSNKANLTSHAGHMLLFCCSTGRRDQRATHLPCGCISPSNIITHCCLAWHSPSYTQQLVRQNAASFGPAYARRRLVSLSASDITAAVRRHRLLTVGTYVVHRLAGYASSEGTVGEQVARLQRKEREDHRRRAVQVTGGPGRGILD